MSNSKLPKLTANLLGSQIKTRDPNDKYIIDPCGPDVTNIYKSELEVLFPLTTDGEKKTVPLMGGSILKISIGKEIDSNDERLSYYVEQIKDKTTENLNSEEILKIELKSTSTLRVAINKILIESVFSDQNTGFTPSIYLSSTTDSYDKIEEFKDNLFSIRKNAIFGFFPIESIRAILKKISTGYNNGEEIVSKIGNWSGLSGKKYKELYDISIKKEPSDDEMILLIMDMIPFLNISSKDILSKPKKPGLGGYYTVVGKTIYLKMPDISGFDSAGFGNDYMEDSEPVLNLLIQLINHDDVNGENAIKNLKLNKVTPIYGTIEEPIKSDYDLRVPEIFEVQFSANKKPEKIYLSPAISKNISIKNDNLRLIRSSQSGNFIEYNAYPNPFVSIIKEEIIIDKNSSNFGASNPSEIDQPFSEVQFFNGILDVPIGLSKVRSFIDKAYNNGAGEKGPIGPYLDKVFPKTTLGFSVASQIDAGTDIKSYYGAGFPTIPELFQKTSAVIGQTLSTDEFVGNLSRENLILHHGKAFDDKDQESAGKLGNNLKYFSKNFIASPIGLCQNYRPRVFTLPERFLPSTWIASDKISEKDDGYVAEFSAASILKFYNNSASDLRFVVYGFDGDCQISKFENGYIRVTPSSPSISSITPDGFKNGGIILKCNTAEDIAGSNKIKIESELAQNIDSVKINGFEIKKSEFSEVGPNYIEVIIPCNEVIVAGKAEVVISSGGDSSSVSPIYIANVEKIDANIVNPADLPEKKPEDDSFTTSEVSSGTLIISGQNYEIPISYTDPRSRIVIRSSKSIFKDGRKIYLYVATDSESVTKSFSQSVVKVSDGSKSIYVAKDFVYNISNSPASDFYRSSKRKAYLYFPGSENITRPVGLLTSGISKAYFILSTTNPSEFSSEDTFGILELGKDATESEPARKPFVEPPLVVGMAAKFHDGVDKNHFYNFIDPRYKNIAEKILKEELSTAPRIPQDIISGQDKFKKLLVLFKYRDIKKYAKRRIKLYVNNKKVSKTFSLEGVKRASDLMSSQDDAFYIFYSKELYYFIISDVLISSSDNVDVKVEIYDADFKISTNTKDKYIDRTIRVKKSSISKSAESNSIYINEEVPQKFISEGGSGYLFGSYTYERALTGFFLKDYLKNIFKFDNFPAADITSNLTCTIHEKDSVDSSDIKVSLLRNSTTNSIASLPNSYLTIKSGSEVSGSEYIEGDEDYLIYHRLIANNICKIAPIKPEILQVYPSDVLVPGSKVKLTVQNMLNYFVVEIAGVKAKIVSTVSIGGGKHEVDVIVPQSIIDVIPLDKCGLLAYNGNQILEAGIGQLGQAAADALENIIGGVLSDVTQMFEEFKQKLKEVPLKFLGLNMDSINMAKNLITSFCNYSFKITADLKFHLDGFTQLLIPIKVIFCILDVICNLFNPFQLPLAIIRLFECLYDLILMLPQISIPIMLFNLLIHMLDFLECLIVRIVNLIIAINLITDALAAALIPDLVNFRELMVLEELLFKYVISVEADLELMEPIVQIMALFLQLLGISIRFPCTINPGSLTAPCGIDGFELGSMISGLIGEPTGSAPDIKYLFNKKYLIPVSQPFTKSKSEENPSVWTGTSYENSTEPERGMLAITGPTTDGETLYDSLNFNDESMRVKSIAFDPANIEDITTDICVGLNASYTKRKKNLGSPQSIIFKFKERTWESWFPALDRQIIDENQSFDVPITLLSKDGANLNYAGSSSHGNFYSMIDMKAMMTTPTSDNTASIRPLTLDIIQEGVTVERTFDTIPAMVLLDDEFNVYIIEENGIIFEEYDEVKGSKNSVLGISEIRATIINQQSSVATSFSKEDEKYEYEDSDGNTQEDVREIFSMPQLYFVDTRVAAEAIQAKCETASINQLPLDMSGDGGLSEVEKMSTCIQDFLASVKSQTTDIRTKLSLGELPNKMSQEKVTAAYEKLVDCTNSSISNLCSIVVNSLNTSFMLVDDNDFTEILPDPIASAEAVTGGIISGPSFTGAREYAGGIGDAITVESGTAANILLLPRDVYDNRMYYDLSQKARIDIISDTTDGARLVLHPTDSNSQNYWEYNKTEGSYFAQITSVTPGIVKIRATVCSSPVQALTYSDLITTDSGADSTGCVPDATTSSNITGSTPLGALSRIDRILTITFIEKSIKTINIANIDDSGSIITEPQLFGTELEN